MGEEAGPELIERGKHDAKAFGELYDLYFDRIYAFCRGHSSNRDEAEDLTAQTFERALASIVRYRWTGVAFSSWLYRIAANLAIDSARLGGRSIQLESDRALTGYLDRSVEDESARWVDEWQRAEWVQTHIGNLPTDQQRALRLRFWDDRSLAEVAREMERSEGAIKQLLHRAAGALRVHMGEEMTADAD